MLNNTTSLGQELIESLKQVRLHVEGKITLPSRTVRAPAAVNIKQIRKGLELTQSQFADFFGFTLGAVKDWEQKRRNPEKSARILLAIIAKNPQIVWQVLNQL